MKYCTVCGIQKDLTQFYAQKKMPDGTFNQCKECVKSRVRRNRIEKIEYYREYDRDRGARQDPSYLREYRAKYPRKYAAHTAVRNAIKAGVLVAQTCEVCGSAEKLHAHHDDYSQQLNIRWMCTACHKQWHILNGEGKNGS